MGLLAACLGIERREEARLTKFQEKLRYGVRVDQQGVVVHDYHTSQTPAKSKYRDLPTRRDEVVLAGSTFDLETILSKREYRADAAYTIAIWSDDEGLDSLREALLAPVFTPFLGRKSCVISDPMAPAIVEANTLFDAFEIYGFSTAVKTDRLVRYLWEGGSEGFEGFNQLERHDRVISRARWQFGSNPVNEAFVARGGDDVFH
jgi:CRISPR system Cascade subunit CasD